MAQYILTLADYNIQLHHRAGLLNRADKLSRRPDYDNGKEDNKEVTPLPTSLFAKSAMLDQTISSHQKTNNDQLEKIKKEYQCELINGIWKREGQSIILDNDTQRKVLKECHDHPMAGHPRMASTYFLT